LIVSDFFKKAIIEEVHILESIVKTVELAFLPKNSFLSEAYTYSNITNDKVVTKNPMMMTMMLAN